MFIVTTLLNWHAVLPARAASRSAQVNSSVLYQADWSKGTDGWQLFPGFTVSHGMLTFDGQSDSGAFAPFKLTGVSHFAIESTLRVGTSASPDKAFYAIFARRVSPHSDTGLFAGYAAVAGEKSATNVASLYWDVPQAYYVPGAPMLPDTGFHTLRLEVQGTVYRFLLDGRVLIPWTLVKLVHPGELMGLVFTYIPAVVKTYTVYALPATPITAGHDTSTLLHHVIAAGAIPLSADSAVFRDNARYALDNNVPLPTLQRTGRVYGYLQGFQDSATYVEQSVNVHQSPAGAQAAFDFFAGRIRRSAGTFQGYHVVDVSSHQIGDGSFAFGYQYLYQGSPSYVLKVLFYRGDYYVSITVDSSDQSVDPSAIVYAKMADALLRQTGAQ